MLDAFLTTATGLQKPIRQSGDRIIERDNDEAL